jgi:hypothetical protein
MTDSLFYVEAQFVNRLSGYIAVINTVARECSPRAFLWNRYELWYVSTNMKHGDSR